MVISKRALVHAFVAANMLVAVGCADDMLAKGLLVAGGAGAGAFIGSKVAPNSGITGPIVGAAAGGALGLILGQQIGKK